LKVLISTPASGAVVRAATLHGSSTSSRARHHSIQLPDYLSFYSLIVLIRSHESIPEPLTTAITLHVLLAFLASFSF